MQPKSNGGQAGTDVYLFGTALVEEFGGLAKLGSADNGIVNQQQALVSDQGIYRDQLHLRDQVSSGSDSAA